MDLVHRHRDRDQLRLVVPALGEERPDRPVDHARGQRRLLAGFALATEERAGDLARGVHPLLDVDGEGKEVHVAQVADGCGAEHHRVAGLNHDRATRLLREFAGLEGNLAVADIRRNAGYVKHAHLVVLPPAARLAAICFQNSRSLSEKRVQPALRNTVWASKMAGGATPARIPDSKSRRTRAGNRIGAAIGLEAVEVEPEPLGPLPEVRIVDVAAVGVERVDHLEEAALQPAASAAACRAGERGCLLATGKWRKTSRAWPRGELRPGGGAVRAAEVGVDDQRRSPRRARGHPARPAGPGRCSGQLIGALGR